MTTPHKPRIIYKILFIYYCNGKYRKEKKHETKRVSKLLELVCNKQDSLLAHGLWDSEEYKLMEHLKVKLKKKTKKK